ncbi:ABC transporter ATP-binding protein [Phytoactinopolyspora mesophila]|uniref:ATP-binding cassette domain-containing protein n=1 Tax=Phytoactinopolyspora mesophila TaxID=2650750 RepID=A0A7K3M666_9ACTN|nr:ABC transporter ATP-binding protein [Phytoactinopolyspora mesophila]NDL58710.1 ATP-binding cassette domain-containing protein [Phytoactinopolyspora mesophila]
MPQITLSAIDKSYESDQKSKAVDNLYLDIPDGAFMCLLGPSGCGKTTTLRMIAGLEQPTAGEIRVDDRVLDAVSQGIFIPTEKRQMGLVFQSYALWPHLTVEKNVDFGLRIQKVPASERAARTDEVLGQLRIDQLKDRYPAQLSGGQQQRVALARMLAVNPSVLLLDEPLSNLDARLRLEMRAELKRIHDRWRTTIVFVTHDQLEAMTLATQVAVMNQGVLQQLGSPMAIYDRPVNRFVAEFVGNPPMNYVVRGESTAPKVAASLAGYAEARGSLEGKVGAVGVRPESLRLVSSPVDVPDGAWHAPARLEAVLPTGSSWTVQLRVLDGTFYLTSADPVNYDMDSDVTCWTRATDLHVFDDSDRRIATYDDSVARRRVEVGSGA